jgi:hypothetical protein
MRDAQRLLNYAFINIRTENLDPEHLSKSFYLGPCPLDETFKNNFMSESTRSDKNQNCSLPATSFSLKLAKNQSAVCLITVKIEIARSLM